MVNGYPCTLAVAPHAGAWIETIELKTTLLGVNGSLPMRERGLKHNDIIITCFFCLVAPHAGAWIETYKYPSECLYTVKSLPMRERGLKRA